MSQMPVLIPSAKEVEFGRQVTEQMLQEYRLCTNKRVIAYITNVGNRLASVSDRQDVPYQFFVLETNMINAFAAPGGFIFVTTGIIKFMDNEAQLAGVIGHELGHVTARHSMKAMELQIGYNILATVLLGTNQDKAAMRQLAQTGAGLLLLKNSRENEYEADNLGTKYAFKAKYNPYEMATFLGKLSSLESSGKQPEFLSTHPSSDKRLAEVRQFSADLTAAGGLAGLEMGTERHASIKKLLK
jgi:predicted Zn-dependent protease